MIPCQRHLFDIPPDVAYLNCAYISPLMHHVREVGEASSRRKCRPWEIGPDDFFSDAEDGRRLFAGLIGASAEDIALVPAASYGVSTAARNVPLAPGRQVLLLQEQFPSNVYPWRERARECGAEVRMLPRPEDDDWTRCILEALDERVAVAALPHVHWTDGALVDLVRVGARCREVGAMLVVDGTQSVGALPFDVAAVQPDFLVVATYKWLLGPYAAGYLYVAPERHDGMPIEHNWADRARSDDFTGLVDYRDAFEPGARRYDVGERGNFHLLPMANAALRQLHEWGVDNIQETIRVRTRRLAEGVNALGIRTLPESLRGGHYLGLRFPDGVPEGLTARLAAERVYVSGRGRDALRVTPHLWVNEDDEARFLEVLAATM